MHKLLRIESMDRLSFAGFPGNNGSENKHQVALIRALGVVAFKAVYDQRSYKEYHRII